MANKTTRFSPVGKEWQHVEEFKNMWGFLPQSSNQMELYKKQDISTIYIALDCALSALACSDLTDKGIETIKEMIKQ